MLILYSKTNFDNVKKILFGKQVGNSFNLAYFEDTINFILVLLDENNVKYTYEAPKHDVSKVILHVELMKFEFV